MSFRAFIKLLRLIFIFSERGSKSIKDTEKDYLKLVNFVYFLGSNLYKIDLKKLSDEEVQALFLKISDKYEKKFMLMNW